MQTRQQQLPTNSNHNMQKHALLDLIAQWPDWKIQALCLDESDLKIKEAILNRRQSSPQY